MNDLIIRSIARRKVRSFLTVLGIMIGIGMIVSLVSITEGLQAEADKAFKGMNTVTVSKKFTYLNIPYEYVNKIEQMAGVSMANPSVSSAVMEIDGKDWVDEGGLVPYFVYGYEPDRLKMSTSGIPQSITRGRGLIEGDRYSAIIGINVANKYNKHPRSRINLDGTEFSVVGIFETGVLLEDNYIVIPLDTAQEMLGVNQEEVNSIVVEVESPEDVDKVAQRIEYTFGDEVRVLTTEEVASQLKDIRDTVSIVTWVIASIAAIVGGIGVINSMAMNVMERRREIGILRAVGWTRIEILKLFLWESTLMGFVGGLGGIFFGVLGIWLAQSFLPELPSAVTPVLVTQVMVFALVLGAGGGLYPAWRATTVEPIEALRYA